MKALENFSTRDAVNELLERLPSRDALGRYVGLQPARSSTASNLALVASGMLLGVAATLLFAPMVARELGLRNGGSRSEPGGDPTDPEGRVLTEM